MSYQYRCTIKPMDFWVLSMRRTYSSLVGICNIIFAVAMILLTVRFWNQAGDLVQALLVLACLIIPVIQPLCVYMKAKIQTSLIPQGTELIFGEDGIHVTLGSEQQFIRWNKVKGVQMETGMVIVYTDARHGYMITNRVMGNEKEDFYNYVKSHISTSEN